MHFEPVTLNPTHKQYSVLMDFKTTIKIVVATLLKPTLYLTSP